MSEDQKALLDLVNYGCAYMQDGKHIPVESVKLMQVDNMVSCQVGYRLLHHGEPMLAGDIYKAPYREWRDVPARNAGECFNALSCYPVARKMET